MSKATDDGPPALGSRENFHGGSGYDGEESTGHEPKPGVSKSRLISSNILRRGPGARILCPECWYEFDDEDDERRVSELTEPRHYVEPSDVELETDGGETVVETRYADHRRHRHCPECSSISWGGLIADRPTEQLLELVRDVIDEVGDVPDATAETLVENVAERKRKQWSDVSNVEAMVRELETGSW